MRKNNLLLIISFVFLVSSFNIAQTVTPSITSVTVSPVTGSSEAQPFYINGANFLTGCTVTLRDITTGLVITNRAIISQSSTQIQLSIKFPMAADNWSVEVINPGNISSGQFYFQIVISNPLNYVLGIDISHYQSDPPLAPIKWDEVKKSGVTFVFTKATQGTSYTDPFYKTNMTDGNNAGLLMGEYHFANPTILNAIDEANHFLAVAGQFIKKGYLPPVLDLEDNPSNNSYPSNMGSVALSAWVELWMSTIKQQTGVDPIIYTNKTYASFLSGSLNKYLLWIAYPDNNPSSPVTNLGIWSNYTFKQFSWTGNVTGISTQVDEDAFKGDSASLYNLVINNPLRVEVENNTAPSSYYLSQNFPNPFNPTTTIRYSVPRTGLVTINIYDVLGEKIATLVNEEKPAGNYSIQFTIGSRQLASGIYFYRMTAGEFIQTKKLIILK